jgi:hypothetical protein
MNSINSTTECHGYTIREQLTRKGNQTIFCYIDRDGKKVCCPTMQQAQERISYLIRSERIKSLEATLTASIAELSSDTVLAITHNLCGFEEESQKLTKSVWKAVV